MFFIWMVLLSEVEQGEAGLNIIDGVGKPLCLVNVVACCRVTQRIDEKGRSAAECWRSLLCEWTMVASLAVTLSSAQHLYVRAVHQTGVPPSQLLGLCYQPLPNAATCQLAFSRRSFAAGLLRFTISTRFPLDIGQSVVVYVRGGVD